MVFSRSKITSTLLALAAATVLSPPSLAAEPVTVISGGDILTMEGSSPRYPEAVVVKDGVIRFVGAKSEAMKLAGSKARLFNLGGKTLMPGFIDAHMHPVQAASMLVPQFITPFDWKFPWGDAKAVRGSAEFMTKLKASEAGTADGVPLVVWGYLKPFHGDLNRAMLDKVSGTRPIIVWSYSAHEMYFNTAALKVYGFTAEEVAGNTQADYQNGFYREAAMIEIAVPKIMSVLFDAKKIPTGLRRVRDLAHQGGVTTMGDMGTGSSGSLKNDLGVITSILDNDASPFRMALVPDAKTLDAQIKDKAKLVSTVKALPETGTVHKTFPKQVKLYADGAFFAEAMRLEPPGYSDGHQGEWMMPPERLEALIGQWWKAGYDIHIHCNGSEALTFILDSLDKAMAVHPGKGQRLVIEHFGVSTPAQSKRIARMGNVFISANPYYHYSMSDAYSNGSLGAKAGAEIVRLGSLAENGVKFALHSDFTMAPMEPLFLAWIAVNRVNAVGNQLAPQERVSVYNALQAVTINAAYMLRLEKLTGSIAVGKKADFVLLDQNPMKIDPMKIKDIEVLGTMFEGKPYPLHQDASPSPEKYDPASIHLDIH